jgi:hypothetical protein
MEVMEEINPSLKATPKFWPRYDPGPSAIPFPQADAVVPDHVISVRIAIAQIRIEGVAEYLGKLYEI